MAEYAISRTVKAAFVLDEREVKRCQGMFDNAVARAEPEISGPAVSLRIELPNARLDDEAVRELLALSNLGKQ